MTNETPTPTSRLTEAESVVPSRAMLESASGARTTQNQPVPTPANGENLMTQFVYVCSNPACYAVHAEDPKAHCPVCIKPSGVGYSTIRRLVQHTSRPAAPAAPRPPENADVAYVRRQMERGNYSSGLANCCDQDEGA